VREFTLEPSRFGLARCPSEMLAVDGIEDAKRMMIDALENTPGPAKDIITLNAGAAIYVGGAASNLDEGVQKARTAIESGAARKKLARLVEVTTRIAHAPQRDVGQVEVGTPV
jgi:anthranilate phosphoribosyltransferase